MKDFLGTILFFLIYWASKNFVYALAGLAFFESVLVLLEFFLKSSFSYSAIGKLFLLWITLGFTLIFQSPLFFQYKTSIIYALIGLILLGSPLSWKKHLHGESLQAHISFDTFLTICPKLAFIFLSASVVNAIAIICLPLSQWVVFKFFLAMILSGSSVGIVLWHSNRLAEAEKS